MLTPKEYAEKKGFACPVCGEIPNLAGDAPEMQYDNGTITVNCSCDCGASWVDVYRLTGYDNLNEKSE